MRAACVAVVIVALVGRVPVAAADTRFVVVDVSEEPRNEAVVASVETEIARLRPSSRPIEDAAMRRLLATGESPFAAASRLSQQAQTKRAANDCDQAVKLAQEAESLCLGSVSMDEERDVLRSVYVTLVICEDQRGRSAERDAAARRLRALVSLPPSELPQDLWERYVAGATPGPATTELQVDSDPPNAQVAIDFRGEGVTPRTLKVPQGLVYVEVQKDEYRKAFRAVQVGTAPVRTSFRLIERSHDRLDQALAALSLLRRSDPAQRPQTLSRLSQLARAETLVLVDVAQGRAKIRFFDAERGAMATETIDSPFDASTGRVAALADRPSPASAAKPAGTATAAKPAGTDGAATLASAGKTTNAAAGLPEAEAKPAAVQVRRPAKPPTPWWGWLIAGALAGGLIGFIYLDRPREKDTLTVRGVWEPPASGQP